LNPVLAEVFDKKKFGEDVIVSLNVMGYRPVIFLKPNIIKTFYLFYAPFRLGPMFTFPMELTQEEKEQGITFEFFMNTVTNDVVHTNWENFIFVIMQKKDKDGTEMDIQIFFWNIYTTAHDSFYMRIPIDYVPDF